MVRYWLMLAIAGSLPACASPSKEAVMTAANPAPDFTLPGSDGKTYSLSEYRGKKPVVLAWFPAAFTPGCTAECKSLRSDGDKLRNLDVAYFAASVDDPQKNADFARSLEVDYPILSDPDRKVAEAYGVLTDDGKYARRWTFYVDKDGNIAHVDKDVQTGSHGADIAAKLEELGLAKK